ncbi:hypothetical protein [Paraburkholderia sp. MM6662-R1]|uniref:hypothetical protein n=1 Tax=Paraburkholderia sp. MM6662-R1 TaxID=2991066 RepID=UPI003D196C10
MARIRTIKPEFWVNPQVVHVSLAARLLFIGTWNFADDHGNLPRDPEKLKMQVFPSALDADIDVEPLVLSLIYQGLLSEYSVSGKRYLHITGFENNQVINRPSKPTFPLPHKDDAPSEDADSAADSVNTHAPLTEGSWTEGSRKGVGKEKDKTSGTNVGEQHNPRAREETVAPVRPADLSAAMRRNSVEASPSDPRVITAAAKGITPETVEAACVEARASDPAGRIKPGFVIAIAERWTQQAAQMRLSPNAQGPPFARLCARDVREARDREFVAAVTGRDASRPPDVFDLAPEDVRDVPDRPT